MEYAANIDKNISRVKARARTIRRLIPPERRQLFCVLSDLYQCFKFAERWNSLTPVQHIELEEYYTDKLLVLLDLGNKYVNRSLPYRLREKEPEEQEKKG
jgi:hypothetical protein